MFSDTVKDIWIANTTYNNAAYNNAYNNAYTTSGSSLNAWAMQAMQAAQGPQVTQATNPPPTKKKPETALAWLREQVEEVTQLAA